MVAMIEIQGNALYSSKRFLVTCAPNNFHVSLFEIAFTGTTNTIVIFPP